MSEGENKSERVQVLMTPTEVSVIDDWGFANRIRSRSDAIRRLCQLGLYVQEIAEDLEKFDAFFWMFKNYHLEEQFKKAPQRLQNLFLETEAASESLNNLIGAIASVAPHNEINDSISSISEAIELNRKRRTQKYKDLMSLVGEKGYEELLKALREFTKQSKKNKPR